jgi:hypothetical protein
MQSKSYMPQNQAILSRLDPALVIHEGGRCRGLFPFLLIPLFFAIGSAREAAAIFRQCVRVPIVMRASDCP